MTTKDAIKLLPLSEDLKLQILRTYDFLDEEQKITISRIAWRTYDLLRETTIDLNIEKQLEKVKKGEARSGPQFYQEVLNASKHDIKKRLSESSTGVDLATARHAMQRIIQEMQDAKVTKKEKAKVNQGSI